MKNAIENENRIHPMAQPQDYIKLAFQSEYGPGHLIADSEAAKQRLYSEWNSVKNLPREEPQDIGGGYIRLCIKGIDEAELENINNAFVASANENSGDDDIFIEKLELIKAMARLKILPFTEQDAEKRIDDYLQGGIRPTSHTETYHKFYKPAYRVVKSSFEK